MTPCKRVNICNSETALTKMGFSFKLSRYCIDLGSRGPKSLRAADIVDGSMVYKYLAMYLVKHSCLREHPPAREDARTLKLLKRIVGLNLNERLAMAHDVSTI